MRSFKERPSDLLVRHPTGGPALSAEVARHIGSDASVLGLLVQMAKDGNPAQRVAIGIGLAKVIVTCGQGLPGVEQTVRHAVAAAGIAELSAAFAAGLGSLEAAAQAAAGGGDTGSGAAPLAGSTRTTALSGGQTGTTAVGGATPTSGGEPMVFSAAGRGPVSFAGKGIQSTYGSTVSPTRP
ncbi:MAG: hypothetical protein K2X43_10610 [Hyphomonadaceae bacterium]|nr:hypothetical protein [Hyphomonadaceae bacterium]